MTEVSQSRSRLLKTTRATMVVFLYSIAEWGAPSGYMRRMVVREPASFSKPSTGALLSLVAEMKMYDIDDAGQNVSLKLIPIVSAEERVHQLRSNIALVPVT